MVLGYHKVEWEVAGRINRNLLISDGQLRLLEILKTDTYVVSLLVYSKISKRYEYESLQILKITLCSVLIRNLFGMAQC